MSTDETEKVYPVPSQPLAPIDPDLQAALLRDLPFPLEVGDEIVGEYDLYRVVGFRLQPHPHGTPTLYVLVKDLRGEKDTDRPHLLDSKYLHRYAKPHKPIAELMKGLTVYAELEKLLEEDNKANESSTSTALALTTTPDRLRQIKTELAERKQRIAALTTLIEQKVRRAQNQMRELERQIVYVGKVIEIGNLYLGLKEEILCIRAGEPAPAATPIILHQLVLYMDEEVGMVRLAQGDLAPFHITWERIGYFDRWLVEDNRIDTLLPEEKGVIMFRPTRQRHYGRVEAEDEHDKMNNRKVYLVIKNGQQVFRIYTDLNIGDKMFPSTQEWQELVKQADKQPDWAESDAVKLVFNYRKTVVLLQGILDRTTVLHPLPRPDLNLFNEETYPHGEVQFIRDAEPSLTEREPYKEWHKRMNATIREGSRVILAPIVGYEYKSFRHRFNLESNVALPPPESGVYVVHGKERRWRSGTEMEFRIIFNPQDVVFPRDGYGSRPRQRGYGFTIKPDDAFVLNYDALRLEDVRYYLNARRERYRYLEILPALRQVLTERETERTYEAPFVALVCHETDAPEELVWDVVWWWKVKNKWKRHLSADDQKAWRMVTKEVRRRLLEEADGDPEA